MRAGKEGRVLYEGNFLARCDDHNLAIAPNQKVYLVRREGTTLIVLPENLCILSGVALLLAELPTPFYRFHSKLRRLKMESLFLIVFLALGSAVAGSVKVINQGQALVERLLQQKLEPGLNFVTLSSIRSFIEKPSGKSLRYSAQQCITRDNDYG